MNLSISKLLYQRRIPTFLVSIVAGIFIVEYFLPYNVPLADLTKELTLWGTILYSCSLLYGITILVMTMIRRAIRRRSGKFTGFRAVAMSATCLGTAVVFTILALATGGTTSTTFRFWYTYIIAYAAGGFYSAWVHHPYNSYRYFRFTSIASSMMFIAWLFISFRELSFFVALWPTFYDIGTWIETVPNTAAQRAMLATTGLGAIVIGIRAILGREPGMIEVEAV
jgi:hypothetical protein